MEHFASISEGSSVKSHYELSLRQYRYQSHFAEEETETHKYFVICQY